MEEDIRIPEVSGISKGPCPKEAEETKIIPLYFSFGLPMYKAKMRRQNYGF